MRNDELLTVPEAMARLKIGRSALYDLLRTRRLASLTSAAPDASPPTPSLTTSSTTWKRPPDDRPQAQEGPR